jgi:hypothetical protein
MPVQKERDWYLEFKNPASRYKYPGSDIFPLHVDLCLALRKHVSIQSLFSLLFLEVAVMYLPLATIESWPPQNYTDPIERGPWVIVITITLYALVLGVVGLRTFTRAFISRSFGADDITILIAMVQLISNQFLFSNIFIRSQQLRSWRLPSLLNLVMDGIAMLGMSRWTR